MITLGIEGSGVEGRSVSGLQVDRVLLEYVSMGISWDESLLDIFNIVVLVKFGWGRLANLVKHRNDY